MKASGTQGTFAIPGPEEGAPGPSSFYGSRPTLLPDLSPHSHVLRENSVGPRAQTERGLLSVCSLHLRTRGGLVAWAKMRMKVSGILESFLKKIF